MLEDTINRACEDVAHWIQGKVGAGAAWAGHGLLHGAIAILPAAALVLLLFAIFGSKRAARGVYWSIAAYIIANALGVMF